MSQELESDSYDVIVIGTGIAESLAAASLANSGKTVLHIDPNEYYGGSQASLTLDELAKWAADRSTSSEAGPSTPSTYSAAQRRRYTHASSSELSPELQASRRQYAISLYPALLPSRGALISTLIQSGVSNYVGFRILDSVSVWQNGLGSVKRVPGSKEEVFKDKSIGLVDKRRLMKFLLFVAGEFEEEEILQGKESIPLPEFLSQSFSLPQHLCQEITYAIAHCSSPNEPTLPALHRTRRYLRALGRYGPSAFLIGQYGGAGEVAQGFCRACAVNGGTYVLGTQAEIEVINLAEDSLAESPISIKLPCHPRPIYAKHLITPLDHLPPTLQPGKSRPKRKRITAHCTAVLSNLPTSLRRSEGNEVAEKTDEDDTAVIIFPPEGQVGLVRGLIMGEGTGSCPAGQFILYLSSIVTDEVDPKSYLRPYLDRFASDPLFEAFYLSHDEITEPNTVNEDATDTSLSSERIVIIEPYNQEERLTEGLDCEAEQGEKAFWAVMGDEANWKPGAKGWWKKEKEDEGQEESEEEIELSGV